ncbi:Uv radiation resistance-associated protein, partial [Globisporangium splendens]
MSSARSVTQFGWQTPSSAPLASFAPPSSAPSPAVGSSSSSGWKNTATLQHLTGFGMRNLSVYGATTGTLMDVYFKLVVDRQVVYVSEVACDTLNPVWVPFQSGDNPLGDGSMRHLLTGTYFDIIVVRVKDRKRLRRKSRALSGRIIMDDDAWEPNTRSFAEDSGDEDDEICVETNGGVLEEEILGMSFSVRELEPLPVPVSDITNLPLNTCLFEINGRTYVKREVTELLLDSGVISMKHSRRKGSAIQLKEYSLHHGVDNLEAVLLTKQKIENMTVHNENLKKQIEHKLVVAKPQVSKEQKRTIMEERVRALRQQVAEKKQNLERLKTLMHDERKIFETDIHIPKALLSTMQMSMKYKDEKQSILERRCEVLRAAHKIRSRQAMLVKQLGAVYPIEYEGVGEYKIRGIKILNSDLTAAGRAEEDTISTALGYIAHLVFMLSKYLQVNLRYRVMPYSSRSYLKDEINDPHGEYPLYKKGSDRERYEKAIYFLRKNVEQLLFSRGLDPTVGSPILARLKALTDSEAAWLLSNRDFHASMSHDSNHSPSDATAAANGTIVPQQRGAPRY